VKDESSHKLADKTKKKFQTNFNWDQDDFIGLLKDNHSFKHINQVYKACKDFKEAHNKSPTYLEIKKHLSQPSSLDILIP
jgi:hypothetical protein